MLFLKLPPEASVILILNETEQGNSTFLKFVSEKWLITYGDCKHYNAARENIKRPWEVACRICGIWWPIANCSHLWRLLWDPSSETLDFSIEYLPEIGKLYNVLVILNEDIHWLDVPVVVFLTVKILDRLEQLLHVEPCLILCQDLLSVHNQV